MFESHDQWFEHFKLLVTTHFRVYGEDSNDIDDIFIFTNWDAHFGSNLRVYEKKHPFPGLIVNFEDWTEDEERNPNWLSKMFQYGFIRLIKLTSHNQINQFPQIIQQAVTWINSPFVSIRCWSTSHNGTQKIGWLLNLLTILFSSMDIPTKALGMMETPTYLTKIRVLLQIVGEIILSMKFWKPPMSYGETIIS